MREAAGANDDRDHAEPHAFTGTRHAIAIRADDTPATLVSDGRSVGSRTTIAS
jgi:hypothetical protein